MTYKEWALHSHSIVSSTCKPLSLCDLASPGFNLPSELPSIRVAWGRSMPIDRERLMLPAARSISSDRVMEAMKPYFSSNGSP